MDKVRIIDTLSYSTFHELFNSTILYMCIEVFDQVEMFCSNSTYQNILKVMNSNGLGCLVEGVNQQDISVIAKDSILGGFMKYLLSSWLNVWHLLIAPSHIQIIYMNNNPLSLWWISLLNFFLRKKILIFCHGELELLIHSPKFYKSSFYYKYILKWLFKYGIMGKRTKMCVLGESILYNLQPFIRKGNKKNFTSIEHPYFFKIQNDEIKLIASKSISIGTVGVLTWEKGLQDLLNISQRIDPSVISLTVVGRVMETINMDFYPNINFLVHNNQFMDRECYEKAIQKLDYILFLYPPDSYKFIASGAVFDAIDMGKPIITLSNDYFQHILKYPIGYICNDIEELIKLINVDNSIKEINQYEIFKGNIEKLKNIYDVRCIVPTFKNILECTYI